MKYYVYTEIHKNGTIERWYYGRWSDENRANEVALDLGGDANTFYCVCGENELESLNILNLPISR